MPLGESGVAVELEIGPAVKLALQVEMVMDGGMNGGEFLQTSHTTKAQHRPFSSPKRLMRILASVVQPAAGFLLVRIADDLHRSAIGTQLIRYHNMRPAVAFHCFS